MNVTSSCRPRRANSAYTRAKPSRNGSDTASVKISGDAPVPPSPPSIVTKSTPRSPSAIASVRSSQNARSPTADLMPTGSPVSAASSSTKSSSESTSSNSACRDGLRQSTPSGTPRVSAISRTPSAAGSTPPSPGLAPWLSLISSARTGAPATSSFSRGRLNRPSSSRQPKYAVPIWKIRSAPLRWYGEIAPSPVLCRQPASAAPRLIASIALPDSEPKLIPETFTTDSGRNACRRPRGPPSTFADGSRASWPTAPWVG